MAYWPNEQSSCHRIFNEGFVANYKRIYKNNKWFLHLHVTISITECLDTVRYFITQNWTYLLNRTSFPYSTGAGGRESGSSCTDGPDRPYKSVTTRPVEYTDLVKRYIQIFVKWRIQIQRSGGHNCSPLECTNLVKWSTKIQRSRVHNSSKVENRNLAVERFWPVRKK